MENCEARIFYVDGRGKVYLEVKCGNDWMLYFERVDENLYMVSAGRREGDFWIGDRPSAEVEKLASQKAAKVLLLWI